MLVRRSRGWPEAQIGNSRSDIHQRTRRMREVGHPTHGLQAAVSLLARSVSLAPRLGVMAAPPPSSSTVSTPSVVGGWGWTGLPSCLYLHVMIVAPGDTGPNPPVSRRGPPDGCPARSMSHQFPITLLNRIYVATTTRNQAKLRFRLVCDSRLEKRAPAMLPSTVTAVKPAMMSHETGTLPR